MLNCWHRRVKPPRLPSILTPEASFSLPTNDTRKNINESMDFAKMFIMNFGRIMFGAAACKYYAIQMEYLIILQFYYGIETDPFHPNL